MQMDNLEKKMSGLEKQMQVVSRLESHVCRLICRLDTKMSLEDHESQTDM